MNQATLALKYDPIEPLLGSSNEALIFFTKRDLLNEKTADVASLWNLRLPGLIIKKQRSDGSWKYPGKINDVRDIRGYDQLETFRQTGFLIEKYGFNKYHPAIRKAANYLFSFQTPEGDFRGIYGTQYATTYSSMIGELLIKAGLANNTRIRQSLDWLLRTRQNDGGWAIPLRTVGAKYMDAVHSQELIQPDRSKPFSHLVTGCVLRALSIHPDYAKRTEVIKAGKLLMSRLFQRDKYPDRAAISFWTGFSYPYWFTDLLTTLDSLSKLGFSADEKQIEKAMRWFINHQSPNGTWKNLRLLRGQDKQQYLWLTLAIARVLKSFGVKI